tara:strand:- start:148 stop:270 length:123 start_codon:yes stop_codon:yes gene_type:complete
MLYQASYGFRSGLWPAPLIPKPDVATYNLLALFKTPKNRI